MVATAQVVSELDRGGLRRFGLLTGGLVAVLFGLLMPWLLGRTLPLWPWAVCGVLALWAALNPRTLAPAYRAWMRFGELMSHVTTPLILGVVFFGLITPMAMIRRALRRDSMARRFEPHCESYRVASCKATKDKLERPY